MAASVSLERFKQLSEQVSLYTPDGVESSELLIICCVWMNAAPEHIAKYTDKYSKEFPEARILLIRNSLFDMYRTPACYREHLAEAVSVIRSHTQSTEKGHTPKIILHLFSNGGLNQAVEMSSHYREFERGPIPALALILDSCPGTGTFSQTYAAVSSALPPNPFFNFLGSVLLRVALSFRAVYASVTGMEDKFTINGRHLNDTSLFDPTSDRVYLYSKADVIVQYTAVEQNADDAERKGWPVEQVRFEKSAHAAHLREDSDRYWNLVMRPIKARL